MQQSFVVLVVYPPSLAVSHCKRQAQYNFKAEFACQGVSSAELQGDLQNYQKSAAWQEAFDVPARADDANVGIRQHGFDMHTCVRSKVREGVESFVQDQEGKRYSFTVKVAAVAVTWVLQVCSSIRELFTGLSDAERQAFNQSTAKIVAVTLLLVWHLVEYIVNLPYMLHRWCSSMLMPAPTCT